MGVMGPLAGSHTAAPGACGGFVGVIALLVRSLSYGGNPMFGGGPPQVHLRPHWAPAVVVVWVIAPISRGWVAGSCFLSCPSLSLFYPSIRGWSCSHSWPVGLLSPSGRLCVRAVFGR